MIGAVLACATPDPLDAERHRVHDAERELLLAAATAALEDGRPADAARAATMGSEVDAAAFGPLLERIAATGDPRALTVLGVGEGLESAEVAERYASGVPASLAGIDRARGAAVLAGAWAEHHVAPDDTLADAAVARRLALVGERLGVVVPEAVGVEPRIARAIAAGLPEAVAVGEGVGAALGSLDRYTRPVWPAELGSWEQHHAGVATGVGVALVAAPDGRPVVELPTPGGPAWRAGVHAGDLVVRVDDRPVAAVAEADAALQGETGSAVAVAVHREGLPLRFALVREEVPEDTVFGWRRTADGWDPFVAPGVALVHVAAFRPHTDEEVDALLAPHAPEAVVLDLRGNGGGDVMAAVNVADRFVADGVLAHLVGRTLAPPAPGPNGELPWNAAVPGHALEGVPVVVLVDRESASASEIVAGALRERAGAVLVGERTFGKGLSQALRVDAALGVGWQVTNGAWQLPSGAGVEGGLTPDVVLALSPGERMLVAELRARRERPPVHPDGTPLPYLGTVARPELPRLSADPQLAAAVEAAAGFASRSPPEVTPAGR